MYKGATVRDLIRRHEAELRRRDEMIQQLLDRLQHPDRTPIWREPVAPQEHETTFDPWALIPDPDQLPA